MNQFEVLLEYSRTAVHDPLLQLDSAWRIPNWDAMKEALSNSDYTCPREVGWRLTMYGGFLLICQPEESKPIKIVERYVESASYLCLTEWRRLPHIVSHIHLPYLQAAQQVSFHLGY